jgi:hypothetical protein
MLQRAKEKAADQRKTRWSANGKKVANRRKHSGRQRSCQLTEAADWPKGCRPAKNSPVGKKLSTSEKLQTAKKAADQ